MPMGRKKKEVKEMESILDQKKINAWIFNSLQSKYKCKTQEEADELLKGKARNIHLRNIEHKGVTYVTLFCKKNTLIAQKPFYYFIDLNQTEYANNDSETDSVSAILSEPTINSIVSGDVTGGGDAGNTKRKVSKRLSGAGV